MQQRIRHLVRLVDRAKTLGIFGAAIIGAAGIVALVIMTSVGVFWRFALKSPIFGLEDVAIVTLSVVAAASVAYGSLHKAHVSVDVFEGVLGPRLEGMVGIVMRILLVLMLGIAAVALVSSACGHERACITSNLSIVHKPIYYVLAGAMGLMTIHYAVECIMMIVGHVEGRSEDDK